MPAIDEGYPADKIAVQVDGRPLALTEAWARREAGVDAPGLAAAFGR